MAATLPDREIMAVDTLPLNIMGRGIPCHTKNVPVPHEYLGFKKSRLLAGFYVICSPAANTVHPCLEGHQGLSPIRHHLRAACQSTAMLPASS